MSFDTQTFFTIILSGFITVWVFRYMTKSEKYIDTFEYLGLSAFWGLMIICIFEFLQKDQEKVSNLLNNHYASGIIFSLFFAPLLGFLGSILARPLKHVFNKIRKICDIK